MPWIKLDENFYDHPKVRAAGNEAIGLHVRALSYSAHYLLDGHIDPDWPREKGGKDFDLLVTRLVRAGLWERNGNGWLIHDYLDFNPSKVQVELERDRRAEAGRKGGLARAERERKL